MNFKEVPSDEAELNYLKEIVEDVLPVNFDKLWHGFTLAEQKELSDLIMSVHKNDNEHQTNFPDFISDLGFIEHFKVTCGIDNKKGAANSAQNSRQRKDFINRAKEYPSKTNNICIIGEMYERNGGTLDGLKESFKKHWISHIESFNKALNGNRYNFDHDKQRSCFMVSSDDLLYVEPAILFKHDKNDLLFGNLTKHFHFDIENSYFLAHDIELLDFMYKYIDIVDYVIYVKPDKSIYELIKVGNIPFIKQLISGYKFDIKSQEKANVFRAVVNGSHAEN